MKARRRLDSRLHRCKILGEGHRSLDDRDLTEEYTKKELTNLHELVMSLVWSEEALVALAGEKGIVTRAEGLEKIKELQEAQAKRPKH